MFSKRESKFLHTEVVKFLKKVLGCDFSADGSGYKSDEVVLQETIGVAPRIVVACRRLGLISKMICFGQYAILFMALAAAAKGGTSWIILD